MTSKKVTITLKPKPKSEIGAEAWVENRHASPKKIKNKWLLFQVPPEVHQRVKRTAFDGGISMNKLLKELVMERYG